MKQVLAYPKAAPGVYELPDPTVQPGRILIETRASLISPGTERASLELHQASLLTKARRRPDLVRQALDKVSAEGLGATVRKVRSRLAQPLAPGYSCAGVIREIGAAIEGLAIGDRVAAVGFGYASHAERVSVPKNLVARIPDTVTFAQAAFGTLGAIALHGVRVTAPTIGETVVVVGLGILGQLTVQILHAAGVRVMAVEPDEFRAELARQGGCVTVGPPGDSARRMAYAQTDGRGADAVIITAAARDEELVNEAAMLARDRGVVTLVGDVPLRLSRRIFYEKELELRVSRSYGPGRYDREYEEKGRDYPYPYVRWTENRNIHAFLDLLAQGKVVVDYLITDRLPIAEAEQAYRVFDGPDSGRHLAVLFEYPEQEPCPSVVSTPIAGKRHASNDGTLGVGFIGFGNFAAGVLRPAFKSLNGIRLTGVATTKSASAYVAADVGGFGFATTDHTQVINDPRTDLVVIATTHDRHADLAVEALRAGKAVFVEKPPAIDAAGLQEVVRAVRTYGGLLQVGFNRRYSPALTEIKEALVGRTGPLSIDYRICAGFTPLSGQHWITDPEVGGGRLVGEVGHFIDAVLYLTDAHPRTVRAHSMRTGEHDDAVVLTLELTDGSVAHIRYLTQAGSGTPKERIDIVGGGITASVDDFRTYGWIAPGERVNRRGRQDKGHTAQLKALVHSLRNTGTAAGDFIAAVYATLTTFAAQDSLRRGEPLTVHIDF